MKRFQASVVSLCQIAVVTSLGLQFMLLNWKSISLPRLTRAQIKSSFKLRLDPSRETQSSSETLEELRAQVGQRLGICSEEQFDSIQSPISFREIQALLGPPTNGFNIGDMTWICADRRWFRFSCIRSYDGKVYDFQARLNPIAPNPNSMSMSRDTGQGYRERFIIPARRPGEIEAATRRIGKREHIEWQ